MNNLQEQQKGVTFQQHKQWLDHPITRQLLDVIGSHEKAIVLSLLSNAGMSTKDNHQHQERNALMLSVQLKTTQKLTKMATDTETFIAYLYNNKQQ